MRKHEREEKGRLDSLHCYSSTPASLKNTHLIWLGSRPLCRLPLASSMRGVVVAAAMCCCWCCCCCYCASSHPCCFMHSAAAERSVYRLPTAAPTDS